MAGRPGTFRPRGIIFHHTGGGRLGNTNSLPTIVNGRKKKNGDYELHPPLCNFYIARDGEIYLITEGVANHAGLGMGVVLQRMISGQPHVRATQNGDTNGNSILYGIEVEYSGVPANETWGAQLGATVELCAFLCQRHRWTANYVIGHKEWSSRKPDPAGIDMDQFRRDVAQRIKGGPVSLQSGKTGVSLPLSGEDAHGPLLSKGYDLGKNTVSPVDVYRSALNVGFNPESAVIITAIAGAESRYHADAVGDKTIAGQRTDDGRTWGPSYGLTQVRSIVQETGTGKSRDKNRLTTVNGNLAAAYDVSSKGTRFTPWSTYTTTLPASDPRSYKYWMPLARDASDGTLNGDVGGALTDGETADGHPENLLDPTVVAPWAAFLNQATLSRYKLGAESLSLSEQLFATFGVTNDELIRLLNIHATQAAEEAFRLSAAARPRLL